MIVLMAFVQYPGFPLTNLPTPMRDALQAGMLCKSFHGNTSMFSFF